MKRKSKYNLVALFLFALTGNAFSANAPIDKTQVKYRTAFGSCPSRTAGSLVLKLIKTFEINNSLHDVKKKIIREKLDEKHFLSNYKVSYEPLQNLINFKFDCPEPLMKVQVYKDGGIESYEAILVENGKLFDPTYEVLLRGEKKLKHDLPFLAIPVGDMDKDAQAKITKLVSSFDPAFRKKISEVILNEAGELTIILSVKGHPSSVFLGGNLWEEKTVKLLKIVNYMQKKRKIPAIINLTNSKKVVVKFTDKL